MAVIKRGVLTVLLFCQTPYSLCWPASTDAEALSSQAAMAPTEQLPRRACQRDRRCANHRLSTYPLSSYFPSFGLSSVPVGFALLVSTAVSPKSWAFP